MTLRAPAKLNLCLYVGARRADGMHELRSLFCPLALADRITIGASESDADEVVCPGVEGPNLVGVAVEALRARGWEHDPVRVEIEKRIPVAAGLGGGSADAGVVLRRLAPERDDLAAVAAGVGADVPSQIDPRFSLVAGAGERIEGLPRPAEFGLVLVPFDRGLAAREVYVEADRLGVGRDTAELDEIGERLRAAAAGGAAPDSYLELLINDLQGAAISLHPEIAEALAALEETGAALAAVTGSGPTAFGLYDDIAAADRAAAALPPRYASAIVTAPQAYL